jgi:hypothetical protein
MSFLKYKAGNEFLPYHPSASHTLPDYRDGWNACFSEAEIRIRQLQAEVEALKQSNTHLREVAASQHAFEEVCEFHIKCDMTPDGLHQWWLQNEALHKYAVLCDESGCKKYATCGFPTGDNDDKFGGYRNTCGDHMRSFEAAEIGRNT